MCSASRGMGKVAYRVGVVLVLTTLFTLVPAVVKAHEEPAQYDDPCSYMDPEIWGDACGFGGGSGVPSGCYETPPYSCDAVCSESNFCSVGGPPHQFCKHYPNSCVSTNNSYCCPY